jgi:IS30 family transposase
MNYKHFSVSERETLQSLWWERKSVRYIAGVLGRSPSSVSRELRRNFPLEHKVYTPRIAHERALEKRKSRGRKDRLKNDVVRTYVVTRLKERWSPEQISGRIKLDLGQSISHEAIYQYIYAQIFRHGWGNVREKCEDLRPYLRRRLKQRRAKGMRRCQRIFTHNGTSIELRPAVVDKRTRIGDWEGDSVESKDHRPGVNTLLERKTGYYLITRLSSKSSTATRYAVQKRFEKLPHSCKRTLTLDNGPENRDWQKLEETTGVKTFFAHPYCSNERGANENANGLLRDYFPKKTNFDMISEAELARVELALNTRPRKRLGWRTPLEEMSVALRG